MTFMDDWLPCRNEKPIRDVFEMRLSYGVQTIMISRLFQRGDEGAAPTSPI